MEFRFFWNSMGHDIIKVTKSVALLTSVISGATTQFVIPLVMLRWQKEIPSRTYLLLLGVTIVVTGIIAFLAGLITTMRYWRQTRIPYKKVIDEQEKFKSCPLCGGSIEQLIFGGFMPMAADPACQSCKTRYHLRQRLFLDDEFEVVTQP